MKSVMIMMIIIMVAMGMMEVLNNEGHNGRYYKDNSANGDDTDDYRW